jgi:hypothetical protein
MQSVVAVLNVAGIDTKVYLVVFNNLLLRQVLILG